MIQILDAKRFSASCLVSTLLLCAFLSGPAIAEFIKIEPFFDNPSVQQLLEERKFDVVREQAESRLRNNPDDGDMLAILGYAQAGLEDWDNARRSVLRAIELAPEESRGDLSVLLAEIQLGAGDAAEAERLLLQIVANNPSNTRALLSTGFLYSRTGNLLKAIDYFNRVLAIDAQHDAALRAVFQIHINVGDYAAVASLARRIPTDSPGKGLGYYFEALALLQQSDPDRGAAIDLLQKSLAVSEPTPQAVFTLSHVLLQEGRAEDAARRLLQTVTLAPDFFDAQRLLGAVLLKLGKPDIAAAHIEQALAIKDSPELRNLLARAYLAAGRGDQGLAELMKSMEDSEQSPDGQISLQALHSYTGGDFDQSEEALSQALEATPDAEHLRFLLIATLLKQKQFESAAREARQALTAHPDQSVLLLNFLGLARLGSGAFDEAEDLLRQALAEDPSSATTRNNLSTVYFRTGQYAKAEGEIKAILSDDPNHLKARVRLARLLQTAYDYEQAEQVLFFDDWNEPGTGTLMRELILMKIREGEFTEALWRANALVGNYPRVFEGYVLQAQALASLGREVDAGEALDKGLEQSGATKGSLAIAASLARVNGWHERAVQYLQRSNARYGLDDPMIRKLFATELIEVGRTQHAREILRSGLGASDPDVMFLMAKSYLSDGDQALAEEYIDAALEAGVSADAIEAQRAELSTALQIKELMNELQASPGDARRYHVLAGAHEFVGNFDAAISVYEDGLDKAVGGLSFQTQIARLLFKKGDTQRAIEVATGIVDSEEVSAESQLQAYAVLGMSWTLQREMKKAERALEQATVEGSQLAPAFYELAKIKSSKGETSVAIQLLQSAIDIDSSSLRYYMALAALYKQSNNIEKVVAVYEDGIARNPGSLQLINNLALVHMGQGENEKALSLALEALELAPDNARVLNTLGRVHSRGQDHKQAIRYLEQAVDLQPASSLYRYHLGMVYFEAGSMDLAEVELQKALDRQTDAPWAPDIRRVLMEIEAS